MLAIIFQEKTKKKKKMLVFPKNTEKNAVIIEKGLSPELSNEFNGGKFKKKNVNEAGKFQKSCNEHGDLKCKLSAVY